MSPRNPELGARRRIASSRVFEKNKNTPERSFKLAEQTEAEGKNQNIVYKDHKPSKKEDLVPVDQTIKDERRKVRLAVDRLIDNSIIANQESINKRKPETIPIILEADIIFKKNEIKRLIKEKKGTQKADGELRKLEAKLASLKGIKEVKQETPVDLKTEVQSSEVVNDSKTDLIKKEMEDVRIRIKKAEEKKEDKLKEFYQRRLKWLEDMLAKNSKENVVEKSSQVNKLKYLSELGYTSADLVSLKINEQKNIFDNQIPKSDWEKSKQENVIPETSVAEEVPSVANPLDVEPTTSVTENASSDEEQFTTVGKYGAITGPSKVEIMSETMVPIKRSEVREGTSVRMLDEEEMVNLLTKKVGSVPVEDVDTEISNLRSEIEVYKNSNSDAGKKLREQNENIIAGLEEKKRGLSGVKEEIGSGWIKDAVIEEITPAEKVEKDIETATSPLTVESFVAEVVSIKAKGEKLNLTDAQKRFYVEHKEEIRQGIENTTGKRTLNEKKGDTSQTPPEFTVATPPPFKSLDTVSDFSKENEIVVNFVDNLMRKDRPSIDKLTEEESKIYDKYKEAIEKEFSRREKEEYELSATGVSPNVRAFLKNEKVLVESEREKEALSIGLERVYENFDKVALAQKAKFRGLSSQGEKQSMIDRLVADDIENKRETFGFADERIIEKMKTLGVLEKDLITKSPEFFGLSPDKQFYVLSKMDQKIYADAELKSKILNEENMKNTKGFFKRIKANFKKDFNQVQLREALINDAKSKHLENYAEDMGVLVNHVGQMPDLSYVRNGQGKLVPYFEYIKTDDSDTYSTQKRFFNDAASKLGEMPYEWSLNTATSGQREKYYTAAASYKSAKESLIRAQKEERDKANPGMSAEAQQAKSAEILANVADMDGSVKFNSWVMANPELERDSKSTLRKLFGANLEDTSKFFLYMGVGGTIKAASRTLGGLSVGVGAAAIFGGLMGLRKKNLEYKEKERRQRSGIDSKDSGVKKFGDSHASYEKIRIEMDRFENETDEQKKTKRLESLKNRIFVVDQMVREGRMDFGKEKDQMVNKFNLSSVIAQATMAVEMSGGFDVEKTEEGKIFARFKNFVHDKGAENYKLKMQAIAAVKGAAIAAAGFGAGALLRAGWDAYGDEIIDLAKSSLLFDGRKALAEALQSKDRIIATNMAAYEASKIGGTVKPTIEPEDNIKLVSRRVNLVPENSNQSPTEIPENVDYNFQNVVDQKVEEGWVHTQSGLSGDTLTKEIPIPEEVPEPTEVEPYAETVDGLPFDSKEISGELDFIYDRKGNIDSVDLPKLQVADISRFRSDPANFLEDGLDESERVKGAKKLLTVRSEVETFLKYQKILEDPRIHPDTPEYKFLISESQNLYTEIQEKMDGIFDPVYEEASVAPLVAEEVTPTPPTPVSEVSPAVSQPIISSNDSDFVPNQEGQVRETVSQNTTGTVVTRETGPMITGKDVVKVGGINRDVPFGQFKDGKVYIPKAATFGWELDSAPMTREEMVQKLLKPNFTERVSNLSRFYDDFDRIAIAQKMVDSNQYPVGSPKHQALVDFIANRKKEMVETLQYGEIFKDASAIKEVSPSVETVSEEAGENSSEVPSEELVKEVEEISRTSEEATYEFDSKKIRGEIKFTYKDDGSVDGLQIDKNGFRVPDDWKWRRLLVNKWEDVARESGLDPEQVNLDMKRLIQLRTIQSAGTSFTPNETKYIASIIKDIELKNKIVIQGLR